MRTTIWTEQHQSLLRNHVQNSSSDSPVSSSSSSSVTCTGTMTVATTVSFSMIQARFRPNTQIKRTPYNNPHKSVPVVVPFSSSSPSVPTTLWQRMSRVSPRRRHDPPPPPPSTTTQSSSNRFSAAYYTPLDPLPPMREQDQNGGNTPATIDDTQAMRTKTESVDHTTKSTTTPTATNPNTPNAQTTKNKKNTNNEILLEHLRKDYDVISTKLHNQDHRRTKDGNFHGDVVTPPPAGRIDHRPWGKGTKPGTITTATPTPTPPAWGTKDYNVLKNVRVRIEEQRQQPLPSQWEQDELTKKNPTTKDEDQDPATMTTTTTTTTAATVTPTNPNTGDDDKDRMSSAHRRHRRHSPACGRRPPTGTEVGVVDLGGARRSSSSLSSTSHPPRAVPRVSPNSLLTHENKIPRRTSQPVFVGDGVRVRRVEPVGKEASNTYPVEGHIDRPSSPPQQPSLSRRLTTQFNSEVTTSSVHNFDDAHKNKDWKELLPTPPDSTTRTPTKHSGTVTTTKSKNRDTIIRGLLLGGAMKNYNNNNYNNSSNNNSIDDPINIRLLNQCSNKIFSEEIDPKVIEALLTHNQGLLPSAPTTTRTKTTPSRSMSMSMSNVIQIDADDCYVHVPKSTNEASFLKNAEEYQWIETILNIMDSSGSSRSSSSSSNVDDSTSSSSPSSSSPNTSSRSNVRTTSTNENVAALWLMNYLVDQYPAAAAKTSLTTTSPALRQSSSSKSSSSLWA